MLFPLWERGTNVQINVLQLIKVIKSCEYLFDYGFAVILKPVFSLGLRGYISHCGMNVSPSTEFWGIVSARQTYLHRC